MSKAEWSRDEDQAQSRLADGGGALLGSRLLDR